MNNGLQFETCKSCGMLHPTFFLHEAIQGVWLCNRCIERGAAVFPDGTLKPIIREVKNDIEMLRFLKEVADELRAYIPDRCMCRLEPVKQTQSDDNE